MYIVSIEDFHSQLWTKDFKSSPPEEDDVEMTGEDSGKVFRVDKDPFEKEMCLVNETIDEEVRVSYVNPKALDQLEEWMSGRHLSVLVWVSVGVHSCQPSLP
jgi:hypothetical protein